MPLFALSIHVSIGDEDYGGPVGVEEVGKFVGEFLEAFGGHVVVNSFDRVIRVLVWGGWGWEEKGTSGGRECKGKSTVVRFGGKLVLDGEVLLWAAAHNDERVADVVGHGWLVLKEQGM